MANDPGPAPGVPGWYVVASLAWLRIARYLMRCRVLSPRRALRLTEPWHLAASAAGLRLPERFYQAAADAGIWPDDMPLPLGSLDRPGRGDQAR